VEVYDTTQNPPVPIHPGYLDAPTTVNDVWKALAQQFIGTGRKKSVKKTAKNVPKTLPRRTKR
jgi:hypothetical protein